VELACYSSALLNAYLFDQEPKQAPFLMAIFNGYGCLDLRLHRGSCKLLTDAILNFGFAILDGKSPTAQSVRLDTCLTFHLN